MKEIDSLYIHFPFCRHLCNYCDFYKHKLVDDQQVFKFEQQLDQQIEFHNKYLNEQGYKLGKLTSLYIGGGTPSLWKENGARFLRDRFSFDKDIEFTIEIDPDTWREEEIDFWQSIGVNRFSIGSQAYSEKYLKIMDRSHQISDVEKTIKYFSERDLNFSVDFMLGLPDSEDVVTGKRKRDVLLELEAVLKYDPSHFSIYILKTRANYPLKKGLPSDEFIREEYLSVSQYLETHGYSHYEVSNFAKKGKESRHNKKYWNYESVAALGPNATGLLANDKSAIRYQWKSVSLGVTEEKLEGSSLMIEKLFLGLRQKNNFSFRSLFLDKKNLLAIDKLIQTWIKRKYIEEKSHLDAVNLTALGFLMCDSLLDDIFREVSF